MFKKVEIRQKCPSNAASGSTRAGIPRSQHFSNNPFGADRCGLPELDAIMKSWNTGRKKNLSINFDQGFRSMKENPSFVLNPFDEELNKKISCSC